MKRYSIEHLYYILKYTPHRGSDQPSIKETKEMSNWCKSISETLQYNPEDAIKELDEDWSSHDELIDYTSDLSSRVHESLKSTCNALKSIDTFRKNLLNLQSVNVISEDVYDIISDNLTEVVDNLEDSLPSPISPMDEICKYTSKENIQKDFLTFSGIKRGLFMFDYNYFCETEGVRMIRDLGISKVSFDGERLIVHYNDNKYFIFPDHITTFCARTHSYEEKHKAEDMRNYFRDWSNPTEDELGLYLMMTGKVFDIYKVFKGLDQK